MADDPKPPAGSDPPTPTPPNPPQPPQPPNPNPPTPPQPTPPTPPQATKAEIERQVKEDLAKQLGVSVEEAAKIIKKAKADQQAQMTEAERLQAEAAEAKAAAEAEKAAAAKERLDMRVERQLLAAGMQAEKTERAKGLLALEPAADDAAVKAAVDQLKGEWPELFAKSGGGRPPGPPSSNPPGTPPAPTPTPDVKQRAAELIKQRFPGAVPAQGGGSQ